MERKDKRFFSSLTFSPDIPHTLSSSSDSPELRSGETGTKTIIAAPQKRISNWRKMTFLVNVLLFLFEIVTQGSPRFWE